MAMIKYLSPEYLAELEKRGGRLPERPGLHVELQHHIRDAPEEGEIAYYFRIEDGRLREARRGTLENPMCSLRMTYATSVKLTLNEIKPLVGLVTGRIRPGGDVARLRTMMPSLQSPEYERVTSEVNGMTRF
ncbi:hypothetical protein E0L36_23625 [Streptomyces sp. AJS327]|uniref:hypothetical protein n=1 Tax=Streptomyces sp. AJS327 TaxID=2545265 RepID=UPI0015DFAAAF|nr:hypothetical protein [Streptomyces sp. AJS327]MBA0053744.1 hypothetical protein [Streptomyces sp. AJS327]